MKVIAITGGPCAGKTSALDSLRGRLERCGAPALFVAEAATDLILSGVAPWTCASMLDFQTRVMALQLEREAQAIAQAARIEAPEATDAAVVADVAEMTDATGKAYVVDATDAANAPAFPESPEVIVVCDRGICDSHAYLSDEEYACALEANGIEEAQALGRYDAVFHLETIAKSKPDEYTKENNGARIENATEAARVDDRGIAAWSQHPAFRIIRNRELFGEKADELWEALADTCGLRTRVFPSGPLLVSACLLGEPCRYDGKSQPCSSVMALRERHELVPVCPEQLGGLPTPRTPSEIQRDGRVVDAEGTDRTDAFEAGAREALRIAREHGCKLAVLKANSPSCGTARIYDGSFSGTLVPGKGKAAALLASKGIEAISEFDVPEFDVSEA